MVLRLIFVLKCKVGFNAKPMKDLTAYPISIEQKLQILLEGGLLLPVLTQSLLHRISRSNDLIFLMDEYRQIRSMFECP